MPISTTTCDADLIANDKFGILTTDITIPAQVDLTGPEYDLGDVSTDPLYADIASINLSDLTCGNTEGDGVFDTLMKAVNSHIKREYGKGRITGDQYAKAYTEILSSVLGNATQFTLNREKSHWDAVTAQMQARAMQIGVINSLVDLEKAKIDTVTARFGMFQTSAEYALTKMKISTEDANYCRLKADQAKTEYETCYSLPAEVAIAQYQLTDVLPMSVAETQVKVDRILPAEATIAEYTNRIMQPLDSQIKQFDLDRSLPAKAGIDEYNLAQLLPVTLAQQQFSLNNTLPAQLSLLKEQAEVQRAQTMDTRLDNLTVIHGSIGKQKELYTQQIDSFVKDARHKAAKMWLDGWITQKTLDEGLLAPTELSNATVNTVLTSLRTDTGLV